MKVGIRIEASDLESSMVAGVAQRIGNLRPATEKVPAIMRSQVGKEFAAQSWFPPGGGSVAWKERVPFGNKTSSKPLMQSSGGYLAALQGGPGSITEVGDDYAVIGASGSQFPYGAVHRGGSRGVESLAPAIIIPKKLSRDGRFAMFYALLFGAGVAISQAKLAAGLELPRRPHLSPHPELYERLQALYRNWLLRGVAAEAA